MLKVAVKIHSFDLYPLQWRHKGCDGISNHQPQDCLLNGLFRRRSKKTSKLCVTGLCVGNSPGTGEFPAKMASYAENVSIWWRHHALMTQFHLATLDDFIIKKTTKNSYVNTLKTESRHDANFVEMRSCSAAEDDKVGFMTSSFQCILDCVDCGSSGNGLCQTNPDSKVHGANMGPIWGWQDLGEPHVGPMNFAIWVKLHWSCILKTFLYSAHET